MAIESSYDGLRRWRVMQEAERAGGFAALVEFHDSPKGDILSFYDLTDEEYETLMAGGSIVKGASDG